jgi:integrase/recombinase XerD
MHDPSILPAFRQEKGKSDIMSDLRQCHVGGNLVLPSMIVMAGERAQKKFVEFFTAHIRNKNTRKSYVIAVRSFCDWCDQNGFHLTDLSPVIIAAYIEQLGQRLVVPSVKQHLAAIRMLFDALVLGHVLESNPASSVRGPKYVIKKGKTPVLSQAEARQFLDAIDISTLAGLRNRALVGIMAFSFARVGAVVKMNVEDFFQNGRRCWFRLHEKGGKFHEVPAHHKAEEFVADYLAAAGIGHDAKGPLFRTFDRHRQLTALRMHANDVLRMVKRQAHDAGLTHRLCCHTWRATGITAYLLNGGTVENAARIACHESARTTQLYNRTSDQVSLDEIERIVF